VAILFLHGGPGSGTEPKYRRFFDPKHYRIILTDQRGSGKSTPHASLNHNTTWDLVSDIEKLRSHLQIDTWIVFGGSWGSTLALAYAETHPTHVSALILRGIFLGRKKELHWFYQFGAHHLFPDAWEGFIKPIPPDERDNLIAAYYKRLTSSDATTRAEAAKAWSAWEGATLKLNPDPQIMQQFTDNFFADAHARIECHYFINHCFFKTDNWLIEHVDAIRHIPAIIIQGRYDIVCPFESAWDLHRAWPEARFEIVPAAGHSASEPGITSALIHATNQMRD
jgi:proline iminopeptidase